MDPSASAQSITLALAILPSVPGTVLTALWGFVGREADMGGDIETVDNRNLGGPALDPLDPFAMPDVAASRHRRPRTVRHAQRTAWLHVRLLPSERIRLTAAAKRAVGYGDVSSWARGTLLAACDGEAPVVLDSDATRAVERLRRDINSGIGSNLNQALTHANGLAKGGIQPDEDALLSAVKAAQTALDLLRADLARLLGPQGRA